MAKEILEANSRTEFNNGLHFYEQDIVLIDYIYSGDFVADINVLYKSPGFGIVIAKYSESETSIEDSSYAYICKIGNYNYSIFSRQFLTQNRLMYQACQTAPDGTLQHYRFKLSGATLYVYLMVNGKETHLSAYKLPEIFSKFRLGIYSNKGNTIQDLEIYNNRPAWWFPNISNTNGGRISFEHDAFRIEKAEKPIELEQEKISLTAGTYYLDYVKENINNTESDIEAFIFDTEDAKYKAMEKNMLTGNKFTVEPKQLVNIFFRGKSGRISNICIKDDETQSYVGTEGGPQERAGSYMEIILNGISKVRWTGVIESVPSYELTEDPTYRIISYSTVNDFTLSALGIPKNISCEYILTVHDNSFDLSIKEKTGASLYDRSFPLSSSSDETLHVFKNLDGKITELILTMADGTEINVLAQRTMKKYVPAAIESPIIVVDQDDNPFDLSASYRVTNDGKYIFTNWEREYFEAAQDIALMHEINGAMDSIIVYGVTDDIQDFSKLYNVASAEMLNSIDEFTKSYDMIASGVFSILDNRLLHFSAQVVEQYKYFIVDYLKNDSYAVNLTEDKQQYEVDISSTAETIKMLYDMAENGQIRRYKILDTAPIDNTYITLRKSEVFGA